MALGRGNIEIDVSARLNTAGLVRQVSAAEKKLQPLNLQLNDKGFRQPLGRISGDLDEFEKSLDASVARTLAFGAAVGVINSLANAFKGMVNSAVEVEKALMDVNVILNLSSSSLERFSADLFETAKNTGQAFQTVSEAAVELSRQGLGAEETISRINDAMILTRLSGMDAAKSVETLTAAVNSFGSTALTTTELVNKLATVDAAFAVSTEDLANALARAGSTAQGAKVNLDELLAAVTSVQQITARGGSVIGNAFKSIFTRIQRSGVREALEEIGVTTTDSMGNIRNAIDIIKDYAGVYKTLSDSQRSYTDELVAGVFQINNFKALVKDLSSDYSIYDRALRQSNSATDEAVRRNEQLQSTLSSLINESSVNVKALAASLGELVATPAIENLLRIFNSFSGAIANALEGEGMIKTFLVGIGKFIAGPGLIILTVAFVKLFKFITGQAGKAMGQIFNLGSAKDKVAETEAKINHLLQNNYKLYEAISNQALNHEQREELVLQTIQSQNRAYQQQQTLISSLAGSGIIQASITPTKAKAKGFIPNYANGVHGAIESERQAISVGTGGASKGAKTKVLRGFPTGGGKKETVVANTDEVIVPNYGGSRGSAIFNKDMIKKAGGAPQGAVPVSKGFVPNFIKSGAGVNTGGKIGFLNTSPYEQALSHYDQKGTVDFKSLLGGIGMITAKGPSGKIDKGTVQNPITYLGSKGAREIIDQLAGSKLNNAEKSELVKRLSKKAKVTYSNIGVSPISAMNKGESMDKIKGQSGSINDIIGPYIAEATAAVSTKIYGKLFGDEVKASQLVSSVYNSATTEIDKISTVGVEGSIFESAIRLGSRESSKGFGGDTNATWDFEENSNISPDLKSMFFDPMGYGSIARADAKRQGSDNLVNEVIEKAYSDKGSASWMRERLNEYHAQQFKPLVSGAIQGKASAGGQPKSAAGGFIPNFPLGEVKKKQQVQRAIAINKEVNDLSKKTNPLFYMPKQALDRYLQSKLPGIPDKRRAIPNNYISKINASANQETAKELSGAIGVSDYKNLVVKLDDITRNNKYKNIYNEVSRYEKSGKKFASQDKLSEYLMQQKGIKTDDPESYAGKAKNWMANLLRPGMNFDIAITKEGKTLTEFDKKVKSVVQDRGGSLGGTKIIGDNFEEAVSVLGGVKFLKSPDALDFSRNKGRQLKIPAEAAKQISLVSSSGYGDAESGSGHPWKKMLSKIIRELGDAGTLRQLTGFNTDKPINLYTGADLKTHPFPDIVARGTDSKKNLKTTFGHFYKASKTKTKERLNELIIGKYKKNYNQLNKEDKKNLNKREINFGYAVDDINLEELNSDGRTKTGKAADKYISSLEKYKRAAAGFIPNFAPSSGGLGLGTGRGGFWSPADSGSGSDSLSREDHFKKNSYGRKGGELDLRSFFPKSGSLAIGNLFKDVMAMAQAGTPYNTVSAGEIVGPRIPKMLVTAKRFLDKKRGAGLKQPPMKIDGYLEPYDLFNSLQRNKNWYEAEKDISKKKGKEFKPSQPGSGIQKAPLSSKYVPKEEQALKNSFKELGLPVNNEDARGGFKEFDRYYLKNLPLFQGGFAEGFIPNYKNEKLEGLGPNSDISNEDLYRGRALNIGYLSSEGGSGSQIFKNLLKQITGAAKEGRPYTGINAGSVVGPRIPSVLIKAKRILDRQRAGGQDIPFMEMDGFMNPPAQLLEKLGKKKREQQESGVQEVGRNQYQTGEEKELAQSFKTLGLNPESWQMVDLNSIPMLQNFSGGFIPNFGQPMLKPSGDQFFIPQKLGATIGNEKFTIKQVSDAILDTFKLLDVSAKPRDSLKLATEYASNVNTTKKPFSKYVLNSKYNFGGDDEEGNPFRPLYTEDVSNSLKGLREFSVNRGKYKPQPIGRGTLKSPNQESRFEASKNYISGFIPNFAKAMGSKKTQPSGTSDSKGTKSPLQRNREYWKSRLVSDDVSSLFPGYASLGIGRGNMPQFDDPVKQELLFEKLRSGELTGKPVSVTKGKTMSAKRVKGTQDEIVGPKISKHMEGAYGKDAYDPDPKKTTGKWMSGRSIMVGSKGRILDGHHSAFAQKLRLLVDGGVGRSKYGKESDLQQAVTIIGAPIASFIKMLLPGGKWANLSDERKAASVNEKIKKVPGGKGTKLKSAGGLIPNFADALQQAIGREKSALKSQGSNAKVYVDQDKRLKGKDNPAGLLVANKRDEPRSGSQGVNRAVANRIDPKRHGSARGMIPNFASGLDALKASNVESSLPTFKSITSGKDNLKIEMPKIEIPNLDETTKELEEDLDKVRETLIREFNELAEAIEKGAKELGLSAEDSAKQLDKLSKKGEQLEGKGVKVKAGMESGALKAPDLGDKEESIAAKSSASSKKLIKTSKAATIVIEKQAKANKKLERGGAHALAKMMGLQMAVSQMGSAVDMDLSGFQGAMGVVQGLDMAVPGLMEKMGKLGPIMQGVAMAGGLMLDLYHEYGDEEKKLIKVLEKDIETRKNSIDVITKNIEKIDKFAEATSKFSDAAKTGKIEIAGKFMQEIFDISRDIGGLDPSAFKEVVDAIGDTEAFNKSVDSFKKAAALGKDLKIVENDFSKMIKSITEQIDEKQFLGIDWGETDTLANTDIGMDQFKDQFETMGRSLTQNLSDDKVIELNKSLINFSTTTGNAGQKMLELQSVFGEFDESTRRYLTTNEKASKELLKNIASLNNYKVALITAQNAFKKAYKPITTLNKGLNDLANALDLAAQSSESAFNTLMEVGKIQSSADLDVMKKTSTVSGADLISGEAAGKIQNSITVAAQKQEGTLKGFASSMLQAAKEGTVSLSGEMGLLIGGINNGKISNDAALNSLINLQKTGDPDQQKMALETIQELRKINQEQIKETATIKATQSSQLQVLNAQVIEFQRNNQLSESQLGALGSLDSGRSDLGGISQFSEAISVMKSMTGGNNELINKLDEQNKQDSQFKNLQKAFESISKQGSEALDIQGLEKEISRFVDSDSFDKLGAQGEAFTRALQGTVKELAQPGGVKGAGDVKEATTVQFTDDALARLSHRMSDAISTSLADLLGIGDGIAKDINAAQDPGALVQFLQTTSQQNAENKKANEDAQANMLNAMSTALGDGMTKLPDVASKLDRAATALLDAAKLIEKDNKSAAGFVPNFAPTDSVSRALSTERGMGAKRPVVDSHPSVGTYVRDAATQPNFGAVKRDHPEGLRQASRNSRAIQSVTNSRGFVPNFAESDYESWDDKYKRQVKDDDFTDKRTGFERGGYEKAIAGGVKRDFEISNPSADHWHKYFAAVFNGGSLVGPIGQGPGVPTFNAKPIGNLEAGGVQRMAAEFFKGYNPYDPFADYRGNPISFDDENERMYNRVAKKYKQGGIAPAEFKRTKMGDKLGNRVGDVMPAIRRAGRYPEDQYSDEFVFMRRDDPSQKAKWDGSTMFATLVRPEMPIFNMLAPDAETNHKGPVFNTAFSIEKIKKEFANYVQRGGHSNESWDVTAFEELINTSTPSNAKYDEDDYRNFIKEGAISANTWPSGLKTVPFGDKETGAVLQLSQENGEMALNALGEGGVTSQKAAYISLLVDEMKKKTQTRKTETVYPLSIKTSPAPVSPPSGVTFGMKGVTAGKKEGDPNIEVNDTQEQFDFENAIPKTFSAISTTSQRTQWSSESAHKQRLALQKSLTTIEQRKAIITNLLFGQDFQGRQMFEKLSDAKDGQRSEKWELSSSDAQKFHKEREFLDGEKKVHDFTLKELDIVEKLLFKNKRANIFDFTTSPAYVKPASGEGKIEQGKLLHWDSEELEYLFETVLADVYDKEAKAEFPDPLKDTFSKTINANNDTPPSFSKFLNSLPEKLFDNTVSAQAGRFKEASEKWSGLLPNLSTAVENLNADGGSEFFEGLPDALTARVVARKDKAFTAPSEDSPILGADGTEGFSLRTKAGELIKPKESQDHKDFKPSDIKGGIDMPKIPEPLKDLVKPPKEEDSDEIKLRNEYYKQLVSDDVRDTEFTKSGLYEWNALERINANKLALPVWIAGLTEQIQKRKEAIKRAESSKFQNRSSTERVNRYNQEIPELQKRINLLQGGENRALGLLWYQNPNDILKLDDRPIGLRTAQGLSYLPKVPSNYEDKYNELTRTFDLITVEAAGDDEDGVSNLDKKLDKRKRFTAEENKNHDMYARATINNGQPFYDLWNRAKTPDEKNEILSGLGGGFPTRLATHEKQDPNSWKKVDDAAFGWTLGDEGFSTDPNVKNSPEVKALIKEASDTQRINLSSIDRSLLDDPTRFLIHQALSLPNNDEASRNIVKNITDNLAAIDVISGSGQGEEARKSGQPRDPFATLNGIETYVSDAFGPLKSKMINLQRPSKDVRKSGSVDVRAIDDPNIDAIKNFIASTQKDAFYEKHKEFFEKQGLDESASIAELISKKKLPKPITQYARFLKWQMEDSELIDMEGFTNALYNNDDAQSKIPNYNAFSQKYSSMQKLYDVGLMTDGYGDLTGLTNVPRGKKTIRNALGETINPMDQMGMGDGLSPFEVLEKMVGSTLGHPQISYLDSILDNTTHPFGSTFEKNIPYDAAFGQELYAALKENLADARVPAFMHGFDKKWVKGEPSGNINSGLVTRYIEAMGKKKKKEEKEKGAARGFVPNFSKIAGEIAASKTAGYKTPVRPSQVKSINIPGVGKSSYNTQESVFKAKGMSQPFIRPPSNSKAAKPYAKKVQKRFNFNPYGKQSADGFVPNFVPPNSMADKNKSGGELLVAIEKLIGLGRQEIDNQEKQINILNETLKSKASEGGFESKAVEGIITAILNFGSGMTNIFNKAVLSLKAPAENTGASVPTSDFKSLNTAAGAITSGVEKLSNQLQTPLSIDASDLSAVVTTMQNIQLSVNVPNIDVNVQGVAGAADQIKQSVGQEVENRVKALLAEQSFVTATQINSWFGTNFS